MIVLARRAPAGEATVGSRATGARESGQARKGAAFSGIARAPQIAWPSPQPTGPRRMFGDLSAKWPQAICGNGAETTGLEVFKGLLQLCSVVHNERPVLRNRLTNWLAAEHIQVKVLCF